MTELANITGLDETLKALRALPRAISGKNGGPLRKALYAAAKVFRAEVKLRMRVRTGLTRDSVSIKRDRAPQDIGAAEHYTVYERAQRVKYAANYRNGRLGRVGKSYSKSVPALRARLLEFGTSKMPAYPTYRPAFEAKKAEALTTFGAALGKEVGKAVEQAKRG